MNSNPVTPAEVDARRGLTERLIDAATAPQLADWPEDHQAIAAEWVPAYELTVAMGHCQLFGFTPEDESWVAPLVSNMVDAAIRGSFRQIRWTLQHLNDLEHDLATSDCSFEDYESAIRILEGRFDLEACRLACESSLNAFRHAGVEFPSVLLALRGAQDEAIRQIDESMSDQRDLLAVADETYWVSNLRSDLAPRVWHPRPWWLSDEIEQLRQFHRRLVQSLQAAEDEMVIRLRYVAPPVQLPGKPSEPVAEETAFSLAADAQAEIPPEELLRFESLESGAGTDASERISIRFRLQQGQRAENYLALPANAAVTIALEVKVPRENLDIDEQSVARRRYVVRWGIHTLTIESRRTVRDHDAIVSLIGQGDMQWDKVKCLFEAKEKIVLIRRTE